MCVWYVCNICVYDVCGGQHWMCSSIELYLIFGDKVFHWTWSSTFWLAWLPVSPRDPLFSMSPALRLQAASLCLAFDLGGTDPNLGLLLVQQVYWVCFCVRNILREQENPIYFKSLFSQKGRVGLVGDVVGSVCHRKTGVQTLSSNTNAECGDNVTVKLSLWADGSWEGRPEGPGAPGLDKTTCSMLRDGPWFKT